MALSPPSAPGPLIGTRILLIRGQKVLLDRDLAQPYQVKAIALRQQVRRIPGAFLPIFSLSSQKKRSHPCYHRMLYLPGAV